MTAAFLAASTETVMAALLGRGALYPYSDIAFTRGRMLPARPVALEIRALVCTECFVGNSLAACDGVSTPYKGDHGLSSPSL